MVPLKTLLFALAATTFLVALQTNANQQCKIEYLPSLAYFAPGEAAALPLDEIAGEPGSDTPLNLLSGFSAKSGFDIKQLPSFEVELGEDCFVCPESIVAAGTRSVVHSEPVKEQVAKYRIAARRNGHILETTVLDQTVEADLATPFEFGPGEAVCFGPFPDLTLPNGKEAYLILTSRIVEEEHASIAAESR